MSESASGCTYPPSTSTSGGSVMKGLPVLERTHTWWLIGAPPRRRTSRRSTRAVYSYALLSSSSAALASALRASSHTTAVCGFCSSCPAHRLRAARAVTEGSVIRREPARSCTCSESGGMPTGSGRSD
jgi:hypothetical protein